MYSNSAQFQKTPLISKEPVRERFSVDAQPRPKSEPDISLWIDQFWRCLHIFARVYDPTDKQIKDSYNCFFQSLSGLLPSTIMRNMMKDFINMTPPIRKALLGNKSLSSFFVVHQEIYEMLTTNPELLFPFCLEDQDRLFAWTFLFHSYYNMVFSIPIENFHALRLTYNPAKINKETWANPLWYMMHSCAYYARPDQHCNTCFKAFMSCLRYALPCPKCRNHLSENLENLDIDNFAHMPNGLFEYTVHLHNTVNQQLGKPIISSEEAKRIYDPYNQPFTRQNMSVARFIA